MKGASTGFNAIGKFGPNTSPDILVLRSLVLSSWPEAEVNTKILEVNKAKSDMTTTISNKVNDIDTRFNNLTSKQQQDSEVIDARAGYNSLNERLEAMEKSPLILFEDIEG